MLLGINLGGVEIEYMKRVFQNGIRLIDNTEYLKGNILLTLK